MVLIDAFVPASTGEHTKHKHYPELLKQAGVSNKALIQFNNRPMLSYVVEALDKTDGIRSITIAGQSKETFTYESTKPIYYIEGGNTTYETTQKAVAHVRSFEQPPDYILSLSSDVPLVTTAMVKRVITAIEDRAAENLEFFWNLVLYEDLNKHFPEVTKLRLKLREATFVTGDIQVFQPSAIDGREWALEMVMGNRKSMKTVIRMFSVKYLLKYLIGRLSVDDLRIRFRNQFDLRAGILLTEFPEACVDLDYAKDLDKFNNWMSQDRRDLQPNEKAMIITSRDELETYLNKRNR